MVTKCSFLRQKMGIHGLSCMNVNSLRQSESAHWFNSKAYVKFGRVVGKIQVWKSPKLESFDQSWKVFSKLKRWYSVIWQQMGAVKLSQFAGKLFRIAVKHLMWWMCPTLIILSWLKSFRLLDLPNCHSQLDVCQ